MATVGGAIAVLALVGIDPFGTAPREACFSPSQTPVVPEPVRLSDLKQTDIIEIPAGYSLSVSACVDEKTAHPGDELTYSVKVSNQGSAPIPYEVLVFNSFDPQVEYVPNSTFVDFGVEREEPFAIEDNWLETGTNLGNISPNTTYVIRFDVRILANVASEAVIENVAQVKSSENWTWRQCASRTTVKI